MIMRWLRREFYLAFLIWGLIIFSPVPALGTNTRTPALKIKEVACGAAHSLILLSDGTVWGCGANESGQLGDKTGENHRIPVKIPVLAEVTAIACGPRFSLALKKDGTVWGWGQNKQGLLGIAGNVPVKIPRLKKVIMIACGASHAFAVKKDGTVWGWGSNHFGQLGDGTRQNRRFPVRIKGLTKVKTVACGTKHTAVVKADGTVWIWGANNSGQLGNGARAAQLKPVKVLGLIEIKRVVCGREHTVALKKDGSIFSWGANGFGQLGDGTKTEKLRPVRVTGLDEVTAIAGGSNFNLAFKKDGTLWGWGSDVYGELGDVKAVESVDECVSCGGKNNVFFYDKPKPVPVMEGTKVATIACGESFAMMVKDDGTIWSWGVNHCGQLAEGSVIDRLVPAQNYYGRIVGKMRLQYQNITADLARARLDQEHDLILLDIRTPAEYRRKHLRKSRLISLTQLKTKVPTVIPDKSTPILVYCKVGIRSARAAAILVRLGYKNVSNLLGGIDDWPYEAASGEQ
jgi:alpha-tubulin suppressor-like RCC1 family protein/rhodanese-related sulfurtransferase